MNKSGKLLDELVRHLVDENILPYYDDLSIYMPDTMYNRKVLFNRLYDMGLTIDSGVVNCKDKIITADFSNVSKKLNREPARPVKVGIINENKLSELSPEQPVEVFSKTSIIDNPKMPITCFIMNRNYEVLREVKDNGKLLFSNTPQEAISFFKEMAYTLIKKKEFQDCFVLEIASEDSEDKTKDMVLSFFLSSCWNKQKFN